MRAVNTVSKHTHRHTDTHTHTHTHTVTHVHRHTCTHVHTHLSNRHSQWTIVEHLSGRVGEHLTGEAKLIGPHYLVVTHFLPGWVMGKIGKRGWIWDIRTQRGDTHTR